MKSIELFAGAGGLGMGVTLAGFRNLAIIERDRHACFTLRRNQERAFPLVNDWNIFEGDVRQFDLSKVPEGLDLITGGPPCQPFSMGGKHRAFDDHRDMFPVAIDIVRELKPRAFIFENVKGLTRPSFTNYYTYILLQLEFPEVRRRPHEDWNDHFARLQKEKTCGKLHHDRGLAYNVLPTLVNSANFGIPQRRERVFIVGFRDDLGVRWSFPRETHSLDALLYDQWLSGEYWERHEISRKDRPSVPTHLQLRVNQLGRKGAPMFERRWRTVRDAIRDLPNPKLNESRVVDNHKLQLGAKVYPGHTGSPLDFPGKTLKAGDHGVPGGENMLICDSGDVRYLTIREAARLQTFPDGYVFDGSWTEAMRQLGNAVPVSLAQIVAASVAEKLVEAATMKLRKKSVQPA